MDVPVHDPPVTPWTSPIEGACWARISICDSWLPEPLSPLFATTLFPRLVEEWTANWAGGSPGRSRNPIVPRSMHGTLNGYAYLRIDFPLNRHPWLTLRLIGHWCSFHLSPVERRWRREVLPRHRRRVQELSALDLTALDAAHLLQVLEELEILSGRSLGHHRRPGMVLERW